MNTRLLIDNVVHQTTVLIAHLATAAGLRAPLAHIANQIFLDLVRALEAEGLGRKVVADMFGLALRSYQLKVQRLSESATERNTTLWQALLDYLRERETVTRRQIMRRFRYDDELAVRSILNDLVVSGLVFKSGRGEGTAYRAATVDDLDRVASEPSSEEAAAALVWVTLHSLGRATAAELAKVLVIEAEVLETALNQLVSEGRISRENQAADPVYSAISCTVPLGAAVGWEAAVFDHFQAMVSALCVKLHSGKTRSRASDRTGGSTYHFDVWAGHPHETEVIDLFSRLRDELSALRTKVSAYSESHPLPPEGANRFTLYLGQLVREGMVWDNPNAAEEKP